VNCVFLCIGFVDCVVLCIVCFVDVYCTAATGSLPDCSLIQDDIKKRELLKNKAKIEEIQKKKLLTEIEPLQLAF
jgi:hypothetical protein